MLTVVVNVLLHLVDEPVDALGGHLGSVVAVEGAGHAALLHVAEHVGAAGEHALALLREQVVHKLRRVVRIRILVPEKRKVICASAFYFGLCVCV